MIKAFLSTIISIFLIAFFVPSLSYSNWTALIIASIVLMILMAVVKPILKLLFLPINLVTLGLFSFVINALILWLVQVLVPGFNIRPMILAGVYLNEFFTLVVLAAGISLVQNVLHKIL